MIGGKENDELFARQKERESATLDGSVPDWYDPYHAAWEPFKQFSRENVTHGHFVKWYWYIYKAAWRAARD